MRPTSSPNLPPLVPGSPVIDVQFWVDAARKYGPAYRVRYPTAPTGEMTVLAGIEANEFAARRGHEVFTTAQHDEKLPRNVVKPALSREATAPFIRDMIEAVEKQIDALKDGDTIPLLEFIQRITADELALAAAGSPFPDLFKETDRVANRVCGSLLSALLTHPPILERVRAEVDKAYVHGMPALKELQSMSTLRHCFKETLRLYTIAPAVPRPATKSFEFLGYGIPEGTYVFVAVIVPHLDERYFANPLEFEPDRFAQPRSEGARPYAYAPFGVGPHESPGAGLVETIALTTMCGLLRRLDFELDSPDRLKIHLRNPGTASVSTSFETELETALPGLTLSAEEVQRFADGVVRRSYSPGAIILRQSSEASEFFVVVDGVAEVEREVEPGRREQLAAISAGEYFGEIGLLHAIPRIATVRAGAHGLTVLVIGRELFTHMVAEHDLVSDEIARMAQRRLMVNQLARAIPGLTVEAMAKVSSHLTRKRFAAGDIVIRQGDPSDNFYIIVSGETEVVNHHPRGDDILLGRLGPGEYFGEIGILHNRPRTATVRVIGPTDLEVLVLGRDHFLALQAAGYHSGRAIAEKAMQRLLSLAGQE